MKTPIKNTYLLTTYRNRYIANDTHHRWTLVEGFWCCPNLQRNILKTILLFVSWAKYLILDDFNIIARGSEILKLCCQKWGQVLLALSWEPLLQTFCALWVDGIDLCTGSISLLFLVSCNAFYWKAHCCLFKRTTALSLPRVLQNVICQILFYPGLCKGVTSTSVHGMLSEML